MDAHHGNGTQETFYATDRVLYTSLHENPRFFPGTGFLEETGEKEGLGFNVNIPLPFGTADQIYLKALKEIVVPIIRQYSPEFMLISAGLDSHYADPVGRLALSAMCYDHIFKTITELALKTCGGRFVAVLEGGYNPSFIGKLAAIALGRMSGNQYVIRDKVPKSKKKITKQGEYVIEEAKKIQRNFWKLD
jgi:acetoin utilization deacetylase AcuC-like enzyme